MFKYCINLHNKLQYLWYLFYLNFKIYTHYTWNSKSTFLEQSILLDVHLNNKDSLNINLVIKITNNGTQDIELMLTAATEKKI